MAYPKIEGERLDIVLQKLRDKGEATPLDGAEAFEALLNRSSPTPSYSSIEAQLIDFVMPLIKDGSIFQENRTIRLLEYLRDEILPQWDECQELSRVIDNEISCYNDLRERRQSGIAA